MKFTTLVVAFAALVSAAPSEVDVVKRDVWNPHIEVPNHDTVWKAGYTYEVIWDTSDAPENISNGAAIFLRRHDRTFVNDPLALGFDLRSGHQEVTVPQWVQPGDDYQIVLFGDSGNFGEPFTILHEKHHYHE
ncbi:hypothetical protein PENSPDRAFT_570931 [Peniophora sp. CONT]|nr:hypothetical protein PENSPDRAFT_570931 [Peniophora sp. CONT]